MEWRDSEHCSFGNGLYMSIQPIKMVMLMMGMILGNFGKILRNFLELLGFEGTFPRDYRDFCQDNDPVEIRN